MSEFFKDAAPSLLNDAVLMALFGVFLAWWTKRQDKKEAARIRREVLSYQADKAALALGEACATAIIHGNHIEDLQKARDFATQIKHEQQNHMAEEAARNG